MAAATAGLRSRASAQPNTVSGRPRSWNSAQHAPEADAAAVLEHALGRQVAALHAVVGRARFGQRGLRERRRRGRCTRSLPRSSPRSSRRSAPRPASAGGAGGRRSRRDRAGRAWTCARFYNAAATREATVVHFGLFVEEMRQGASQPSAFRDVFELADRAEAWGVDCLWLGEIHFTPVALGHLRLAPGRERDRQPHPPAPRGDRRPGPAAEPSAAHRRRGRDASITSARAASSSGSAAAASCGPTTSTAWPTPRARRASARRWRSSALGWKGEPFSYEGQFYRVQNATVVPRRTRCRTRRSAWPRPATRRSRWPAGWGCRSSSGCATTEIPDLQDQLAPYRQAWREAGHRGEPSVYLRIPVYVSTDGAGRRSTSRARACASFFARQTELARPPSVARAPGPPIAARCRPSGWRA